MRRLRWRYSRATQYHYYEDDKSGWGYIIKRDGRYLAHGHRSSCETKLLREAKKFVENDVAKR